MDVSILNDKDRAVDLIVERLGAIPIDYSERFEYIKGKREKDKNWLAAGVLLPLFFKETFTGAKGGEFVIQLIKRSPGVPQGGDLSGPGGMLNPFIDRLLMWLLFCGVPPALQKGTSRYMKRRGKLTTGNIVLFLANAIREAWEEVKLSPFNLTFLGPLPSYSLTLFTRTIFPVVVLVKKNWIFRPNWEVEKVVEIPLASFFSKENHAIYSIETSSGLNEKKGEPWNFPCLTHKDYDGEEEILWGATFNIIISFLKIVFDFELPDTGSKRIIHKTLHPGYLTGNLKK